MAALTVTFENGHPLFVHHCISTTFTFIFVLKRFVYPLTCILPNALHSLIHYLISSTSFLFVLSSPRRPRQHEQSFRGPSCALSSQSYKGLRMMSYGVTHFVVWNQR
ncbi:hypothetical protein EDB85DRAFT_882736 [Lactarius pseudohatsudake]|nr:hypothetical protein EDB85DRAFT_882736 [Lactarius pseudohatsudake]